MAIFFYGCVTLDGYLADKNNSIDWLHNIGSVAETSYDTFYDQMDVLIMGRKTYDDIKDMPHLTDFYGKTKNYVFTHHPDDLHPLFEGVSGDLISFLNQISDDKNVWVLGGNTLIAPLLNDDLIDTIYLQIAPVLLGKGVPLFTQQEGLKRFQLIETNQYGQFAELVLTRKSSS